jgi:hypothetical protein
MDIIGQVIDSGISRFFTKGYLVVSPGVVGYSDGCSFQTHLLVREDCCAKVSILKVSMNAVSCGIVYGRRWTEYAL